MFFSSKNKTLNKTLTLTDQVLTAEQQGYIGFSLRDRQIFIDVELWSEFSHFPKKTLKFLYGCLCALNVKLSNLGLPIQKESDTTYCFLTTTLPPNEIPLPAFKNATPQYHSPLDSLRFKGIPIFQLTYINGHIYNMIEYDPLWPEILALAAEHEKSQAQATHDLDHQFDELLGK